MSRPFPFAAVAVLGVLLTNTWNELLAQPVRVERIDSKYEVAPIGKPGRFSTGQPADLMLSGIDFNNTGGPLLFNHPSGLASDGKRLFVCDRFNNRVLIWTTLPAGNVPPELVLGQPTLSSNNPGEGRHELNWPGNVSVSPDGATVAVADTNNDRLLVWNSVPAKNGAEADVVLELSRLSGGARPELRGGPGRRLGWPWGVWTDGKKLAAIATHGGALLVWNTLPNRDHQPPDAIIRLPDSGTPRNITSDGTFLIVGDHNYGERSRPGSMVWRQWPTTSSHDPDFVWGEWLKGTSSPDGKLLLAGMQKIYLWNSFPPTNTTDPEVVLRPASYRNGDGPDLVFAGGRLYACNYNGNNILAWNSLPTRDNQPADFAIGSDDPNRNTLDDHFFIMNPNVASDRKSLFVSSDFDRKLYVWKNLPNQSGAKPDLVYSLPEAPWDNALYKNTFVLAGKSTVMIWRHLPVDGAPPDQVLNRRIGSVELREITGVALDDRYFYLSDRDAGTVYVWEGIPTRDSEPAFTLEQRDRPGQLNSDGDWLCVAPFDGQSIQLYQVSELGAQAVPYPLGARGRFNLPGSALVSRGKLFVADRGNHRVHVWNSVNAALDGQPADALLGTEDDQTRKARIGRDRLFMPATLAYDGAALWVGEFKFSSRLLRFSPTATREEIPTSTSQARALPQTEWPKFRGDLLNTGYSSSTAPRAPFVAWSKKISGAREFWSSPAVFREKLYVGNSNGNVYCLNASTGDLIWTFYGRSHPIFSSPAVAEDRVYFGAADRKIYALPADDPNADGVISDGEIIWDYTVGPSTGGVNNVIPSSPAIKDGKLFLGAIDQYFYCFDAKTGEVIWKTWTPYRGQHAFSSSPAIDKGRVFAATGNQPGKTSSGRLYCFDESTGRILWEFDIDDITYSSPVIDQKNSRVVIGNSGDWIADAGNRTYRMYSLALEGAVDGTDQGIADSHVGNSDLVWSFDTGRYVYSSPAIHDGRLYFGGSDGNLRCLDSQSGTLVWKCETPARTSGIMGSPAIADGMVFVGTADGRLIVVPETDPNNDGVISADEIVWSYQMRGKIVSSPAIANGSIYLGGSDGTMYCFRSKHP